MWPKKLLFLWFFVGFAFASKDGRKSDKEYTYSIHGRTLAKLQDVDNQYSGIIMKADLHIQSQSSDDYLYAKIKNAQYAQIHAQLPNGWDSEISSSKLNYQKLQFSEQAFKIKMEKGVVQELIVSEEVSDWQANRIKSIVSQLQLDTLGQNVVKSSINQLPKESSNNAVFKTMEETDIGKCETLYDIFPLPKDVLQFQPELVPLPQIMKDDDKIIEIVKTKNFSNTVEIFDCHFDLGPMNKLEPFSPDMGHVFLRSSVSRAVVTGNRTRYTIQSTHTTNKITISPTLNNEQKGMVVNHLKLTLKQVKQVIKPQDIFQNPQNPSPPQSLAYRCSHIPEKSAYSSSSSSSSSEEEVSHLKQLHSNSQSNENHRQRQLRDLRQQIGDNERDAASTSSSSSSSSSSQSFESAQRVSIVEAVQKIAQQTGQELQQPNEIQKAKTLANILTSLTRIMTQQEMRETARQLYSKEQNGAKAAGI